MQTVSGSNTKASPTVHTLLSHIHTHTQGEFQPYPLKAPSLMHLHNSLFPLICDPATWILESPQASLVCLEEASINNIVNNVSAISLTFHVTSTLFPFSELKFLLLEPEIVHLCPAQYK